MRVVVADDHRMVREGLVALLEREDFEVVGQADNGLDAVRLCRDLHPRVAVLDLAMPLLNGVDAAREIHRSHRDIGIVVVTMYDANRNVYDALQSGVGGFVVKTKAPEDLMKAIRAVATGGVYLTSETSREVVSASLDGTLDRSPLPLTARERQVLQLVAEGKTTKEIAVILTTSVKTAECHRTRIMKKLDIHHTAGLVHVAIREGLVQA